MALQIDGILFDTLTADPGSPSEGQVWYNTTTKVFGIYRNGVTTYFTDYVQFNAHASATSNPHGTTLEQARSAGSTLGGSINMGGFAITNVGAGSNTTDVAQRQWTTDQINAKVRGLMWQVAVINSITTPPVGPTTGDRYRITATATGVWVGKENQIAEWDGAAWLYTVPSEGFAVRDMTANTQLIFDGTAWGNFGNAVDHNSLLNLATGDAHTQYQLRSEKGASNGYAGLTGTSITDTTHGQRGGGTTAAPLHVVASSSGPGFKPQSNTAAAVNPTVSNDNTQGYLIGSEWLNTTAGTMWVCLGNATGAAIWKELTNAAAGYLVHKAGRVLAAGFAGNPKKATVTFSTPFADTNYSVTITPVTSGNIAYTPIIESQLAGSFVINVTTNNIPNLTQMNWVAVKHGEST